MSSILPDDQSLALPAVNQTGLDSAAVDVAARLIGEAEALLVCAGAGMGVDSGRPDFRGDAGLWRACPPYARLGLSFMDLAAPVHFETDPELAWGFYGHRLGLYRATEPHAGFHLLRGWGGHLPRGARVFASNAKKRGFNPPHDPVGYAYQYNGVWEVAAVAERSDERFQRHYTQGPAVVADVRRSQSKKEMKA